MLQRRKIVAHSLVKYYICWWTGSSQSIIFLQDPIHSFLFSYQLPLLPVGVPDSHQHVLHQRWSLWSGAPRGNGRGGGGGGDTAAAGRSGPVMSVALSVTTVHCPGAVSGWRLWDFHWKRKDRKVPFSQAWSSWTLRRVTYLVFFHSAATLPQ